MSSVVQHEVAHHFESAEQEFSAAKMGMWIFLVTEVLLFSGIFMAYTAFKNLYPEMWAEASKLLDWKLGAVNTVILLTSSFTVVMAVRAAQTNQKGEKNGQIVGLLATTILLAAGFMVVKYFEYTHKFHAGTLPGEYFVYEGLQAPNAHIFFGLYFVATGLHGIHVMIGIGILTWVLLRARKGHFYAGYYTPVECGGLYWHLVDLIWIYLFPLLYLV